MAKKPTRLRFTEDDLTDGNVKKAAGRADKAADKAEKAVDKLTPKHHKKLKQDADVHATRTAKLCFGKADNTAEVAKPSRGKQVLTRAPMAVVSSKAHQAVSQYEDDNVGVQAAHEGLQATESTAYAMDYARYSHKMKAHDKADKLVSKSDKANVDALYEKFKKDNPTASSNPISRWRQKQAIKKEYVTARSGKSTANAASTASKGASKVAQGAKTLSPMSGINPVNITEDDEKRLIGLDNEDAMILENALLKIV